jgi:hypothetical protein
MAFSPVDLCWVYAQLVDKFCITVGVVFGFGFFVVFYWGLAWGLGVLVGCG